METGSRVGPYEIRERIGEGGMAAVYKVWHTGLHRFEALKVPRQSSFGTDSEFVQRLLVEARIAAQLHHPHIVAIHNVSEPEAPIQFFAMDLVVGYDLDTLLERRGRLSIHESLSILRHVAEALDYAHIHGVVHRDVKPGNILLQEVSDPGGWMAKVVDFGISRAAEDTGGTKLTKSGMIVGTPEYMSPEQAGSGEPVDFRTDIYSLGIVAYQVLCGRVPFTVGEGVSRMSILMNHVRDVPRPPIEHISDLPLAANNAVLKALAKHPADRFASCADFMKALSGAVTVTPPAMPGLHTGPTLVTTSAATSVLTTPPAPSVAAASTTPVAAAMETSAPVAAATNGAALNGNTSHTDDRPRAGERQHKPLSGALLGLTGLVVGGALAWAVFGQRTPVANTNESVVNPPSNVAPAAAMQPENTATKPAPSEQTAPDKAPALPTAKPAPARLATRTQQKTVAVKLPFKTNEKRTSALAQGVRKIERAGQAGERTKVLQITMQGDRELARKIVSDRVTKAPVTEEVLVGTRTLTVRRLTPRPVATRSSSTRSSTTRVADAPRRARRARKRESGPTVSHAAVQRSTSSRPRVRRPSQTRRTRSTPGQPRFF